MEVPQEDVGKAVVLQENRTLQQDHAGLQEKFEKVMDGEELKAMFAVSHNEKSFTLKMKKIMRRIGSQSLIMFREFLLAEHSL